MQEHFYRRSLEWPLAELDLRGAWQPELGFQSEQQGQQNGKDELWVGTEKALGLTDHYWGKGNYVP